MSQSTIRYFGYGSLVNEATRPAGSLTTPGRLHGYVRQWRAVGATSFGKVCALSVAPDPDHAIDGVMIEEPADRLAALDAREYRYVRKQVPAGQFVTSHRTDAAHRDAFYYQADGVHAKWADSEYPILQSYVDAVMQGFLHLFGEHGVVHFAATTQGWEAPIVADRALPRYPRSVNLSEAEQDFIDATLKSLGVQFLDLETWAK